MPIKFTPEEHLKRKQATALDCTVKKDSKGNILNPKVVSVADQHFKDECDVNKIIARGMKTGYLVDPTKPLRNGKFGDFTTIPDYQTSLNTVLKMKEEFEALPPEVRARFDNDPEKIIAFVSDPANKAEAIELGLRNKPVFEDKKLETPEGNFWVTYEDGIEIKRVPISAPASAPGA